MILLFHSNYTRKNRLQQTYILTERNTETRDIEYTIEYTNLIIKLAILRVSID